MNKLFGLLISRYHAEPGADVFYMKKHASCACTPRTCQLLDLVLRGVDNGSMPLFASVLCYGVLFSVYGEEIAALDSCNTYVPVRRNPAYAKLEGTVAQLTGNLANPGALSTLLDDDIRERLMTSNWLECMGAACLQMLREIAQ